MVSSQLSCKITRKIHAVFLQNRMKNNFDLHDPAPLPGRGGIHD
uniref:Uncharacterized protein n=1 Tax=Rhizophora mucronata TaxID=61149 RepID=A0A2P2KAH9_RHIMU